MIRRHIQRFGPDLARGPFSSHRVETAARQIATALAQVRAPLTRPAIDVRQHAPLTSAPPHSHRGRRPPACRAPPILDAPAPQPSNDRAGPPVSRSIGPPVHRHRNSVRSNPLE